MHVVEMPASEALHRLRTLLDFLYPPEYAAKMAVEYELVRESGSLPDMRVGHDPDLLQVIQTLCDTSNSGTMRDMAETLWSASFPVQYLIYERVQSFQSALIEMGNAPSCFPVQFGSFLRQGLLDIWQTRQQRGWL